ncbi:hypothetical protein ACTFIU_001322 [Dictyostelium citrinum]
MANKKKEHNSEIESEDNIYLKESYDSIISIQKLLSTDKMSIVREKVNNNNKYLVLNSSPVIQSTNFYSSNNNNNININQTFELIFSKFQINDQDNYNFFKNLFKTYGEKYIEELNIINNNNNNNNNNNKNNNKSDDDYIISSSKFFRNLIMYNCVPSLTVLMNEFNFIPTFTNFFINSIVYGSLPILKYLLIDDENQERKKRLLDEINNKNHDLIWKEVAATNISQDYYGPLNINYKKEKYETILFLLENNFIKRPEKSSIIKDISASLFSTTPIENKLKLKDLILSCKVIDQLLNLTNNNNNNNNYDEISKKFTNEQLESLLTEPINWESNENTNKQIIKDLIEHWYKECNITEFDYEYYICFDKLENDKGRFPVHRTNCITALQYGNYEILLKLLKNPRGLPEFERTTITHDIDNQRKPNYLFTKSQCKEKQKEFISSWIEYINNNNNNNELSFFIFLLLIQNDDIGLLKFSIDKLQDKSILNFNKPNNIIIISDYIRSIEMLEYLYKEYGSKLFINHGGLELFVLRLSTIELLKCFEKLENFKKLTLSNDNIKKSFFDLSMISHIIKNGQGIYEIKELTFNATTTLYDYDNENDRDDLVSLLKYIINEKIDIKIDSFFTHCCNYFVSFKMPPLQYLKLFDWLISMDFQITGLVCENNNLKTIKYLTGRINEINELFTNKKEYDSSIAKFIVQNCDTIAFDLIMKEINKKKSNSVVVDFIDDIITTCCEIGQLKFLEHIQTHHCEILKKRSKGSGWFTQGQLNDIITHSINNNQIDCFELLLKYTNFNYSQFEKITRGSGIFFNYFKNKIKK